MWISIVRAQVERLGTSETEVNNELTHICTILYVRQLIIVILYLKWPAKCSHLFAKVRKLCPKRQLVSLYNFSVKPQARSQKILKGSSF